MAIETRRTVRARDEGDSGTGISKGYTTRFTPMQTPPGHEQRIREHAERIAAELASRGIQCNLTRGAA